MGQAVSMLAGRADEVLAASSIEAPRTLAWHRTVAEAANNPTRAAQLTHVATWLAWTSGRLVNARRAEWATTIAAGIPTRPRASCHQPIQRPPDMTATPISTAPTSTHAVVPSRPIARPCRLPGAGLELVRVAVLTVLMPESVSRHPGAESDPARIALAQHVLGFSGEHVGALGAERSNPLANPVKLTDPLRDPSLCAVKQRRELRSDRLLWPIEIDLGKPHERMKSPLPGVSQTRHLLRDDPDPAAARRRGRRGRLSRPPEWLAALPRVVDADRVGLGARARRAVSPGRPVRVGRAGAGPRGEELVLKVGWRHREAEHEADALRFWDGDGAVRCFADRVARGHDSACCSSAACRERSWGRRCRSPSRTS